MKKIKINKFILSETGYVLKDKPIQKIFSLLLSNILTFAIIAVSVFNVAINGITNNVENKLQVTVLMKNDATEEQIGKAKDFINEQKNIQSVKFSDKKEQLREVMGNDSISENESSYKGISTAFIVKAKDASKIEDISKELSTTPYSKKIVADQSQIDKLMDSINSIKKIVLFSMIFILALTLFLIFDSVVKDIDYKKIEMYQLQLQGYGDQEVRIPYYLASVVSAFAGSIVGLIIADSLLPHILNSNGLYSFIPKPFTTFLIGDFWAVLIVSAANILVTISAVKRNLKDFAFKGATTK